MMTISNIQDLGELVIAKGDTFNLQMNLQSGSTNTFTLNVITEDTQDLEARSYVAKVVLKDENDNLYKKARGIITIKEDSLEVT